jgi:hypothetical protein
MKKMLAVVTFVIALSGLSILFSGCYTQLSTTRDERDEYSYRQKNNDDTTYTDNNRDADQSRDYTYNDNDDWNYGHRLGFSYYYPSYSTYWPSSYFRSSYSNLFSPGGYGYAWYYDPYYCDPWWSYTNLAYDPYYYSPAYYNNPYYYYGSYSSGYSSNVYKPKVREFGANRGNETTGRPVPGTNGYTTPTIGRGTSGVGDATLPTGMSIGGGSARGGVPAAVNTTPRTSGNQKVSTGVRGSNARPSRGARSYGSPAHGGSPRDAQPTYHGGEGEATQPPPAHSTAPSKNSGGTRTHGNREAGSSRGNGSQGDSTPAYHPAPSNPPPPPPSGNNSAPRSGNSRGIRPQFY